MQPEINLYLSTPLIPSFSERQYNLSTALKSLSNMENSNSPTSLPAPATQSDHQTFHPFQRLPTELRLVIWALHSGRVISIYANSSDNYHFYFSAHEPPALLHVNQEAREVAQKTHEFIDRDQSSNIIHSAAGIDDTEVAGRWIWVDWSKDTLFLTSIDNRWDAVQQLRGIPKIPGLKQVKHLAMDQTSDCAFSAVQAYRALPMLDSLTFIRNSGVGGDAEGSEAHGCFFVKDRLKPTTQGEMDSEHGNWSFMKQFCDEKILKSKIRFCHLTSDGAREGERLESGDELVDIASMATSDSKD